MRKTRDRGYGKEHKRRRELVAVTVNAGLASCVRCGKLIDPSEPWDLGHNDWDRSLYAGPEHRFCNRRAGGKRGALVTNRLRRRKRFSRPW